VKDSFSTETKRVTNNNRRSNHKAVEEEPKRLYIERMEKPLMDSARAPLGHPSGARKTLRLPF
jgi:hypothetical protein